MNSADLTFDDMKLLLGLLEHHYNCLSQEVDAQLEQPHHTAMNRKMDILTDNHEASTSNTYFRRLSATYDTTHSGPLPFLGTLFSTIPPPSVSVEGATSICTTVSDSEVFENLRATTSWSHVSYCTGIQFQEAILVSSLRVEDYRYYCLLNTK